MPKRFEPQVITANDLVEGDSVFLAAEGWTRDVRAARVGESPEAIEALMAEAAAAEAGNRVVGAYAVAVALTDTGPWPLVRREQIRAERGPTVPVGPKALPVGPKASVDPERARAA